MLVPSTSTARTSASSYRSRAPAADRGGPRLAVQRWLVPESRLTLHTQQGGAMVLDRARGPWGRAGRLMVVEEFLAGEHRGFLLTRAIRAAAGGQSDPPARSVRPCGAEGPAGGRGGDSLGQVCPARERLCTSCSACWACHALPCGRGETVFSRGRECRPWLVAPPAFTGPRTPTTGRTGRRHRCCSPHLGIYLERQCPTPV